MPAADFGWGMVGMDRGGAFKRSVAGKHYWRRRLASKASMRPQVIEGRKMNAILRVALSNLSRSGARRFSSRGRYLTLAIHSRGGPGGAHLSFEKDAVADDLRLFGGVGDFLDRTTG